MPETALLMHVDSQEYCDVDSAVVRITPEYAATLLRAMEFAAANRHPIPDTQMVSIRLLSAPITFLDLADVQAPDYNAVDLGTATEPTMASQELRVAADVLDPDTDPVVEVSANAAAEAEQDFFASASDVLTAVGDGWVYFTGQRGEYFLKTTILRRQDLEAIATLAQEAA